MCVCVVCVVCVSVSLLSIFDEFHCQLCIPAVGLDPKSIPPRP